MRTNNGTKITIENGDNTMSWNSPYNDVQINDILDAFYGCLVGLTFIPEVIVEAMYEWAKEKLPNDNDTLQ